MPKENEPHHEMVRIEEITLDKENPRIAKWIEMYGEDVTAEQMALALGAGDSPEGDSGTTFTALKQSILTNKGIIHPIIVNRESNGRTIVIEGNTRVSLYREFKEDKRAGNWDTISAMVYENMSKEQIDAIRLQVHLVGTRAWDPYSKAKYLDTLRNKDHLTFSQIVDFCGGKTKEVANYIDAYNDMEKYYRPILSDEGQFDPSRFSAFVELQGRVAEALIGHGFTKTDFAEWVHTKKLYPLNTVRSLPRIIHNPKAKAIFLEEGAGVAIRALETPSAQAVLSEATLEQLSREIYKRINALTFTEIQSLKNNFGDDEVDTIFDAMNVLEQLCKQISPEAD